MTRGEGPGAGLPSRPASTSRWPHQPGDEDADGNRLAAIQAAQEANETVAALRSLERLSEQLLQANRKLDLAVAETARLHRALSERSSAATTAEQRAATLAERLFDCERELQDVRCRSEDASSTMQALQSQLAVANADALRINQALQSQLLLLRTEASNATEALQSKLAAMRASTSWKLSAPVRLAKTLISKRRS